MSEFRRGLAVGRKGTDDWALAVLVGGRGCRRRPPLVSPAIADLAEGQPHADSDAPRFDDALHRGVLGPKDVLDDTPDEMARELVRRAIQDAMGDQSVSTGELTRMVGARFGYAKLRASRIDAIVKLVPTAHLRTGRFCDLVWPVDLDPETWTGSHSPPPGERREVYRIAPEELMNAMVWVLGTGTRKDSEMLA